MKRIGILIALALTLGINPAEARDYTEEQLTLARQLGSLIILRDQCGRRISNVIATAEFTDALEKAGLDWIDLKDGTAFQAVLIKQSGAMKGVRITELSKGKTEAEYQAWACKQIDESYGPKGIIHPGLSSQ